MRVYINNINCNRYSAELFKHNIQPCEVVTFNDWLDGAINPITYKESIFKFSKISLVYYVTGRNETETLTNLSNLIVAHTKCILKFEHLNFRFNCSLESASNERVNLYNYKVTIELKCDFKMKDEITRLAKIPKDTFKQRGNQETPLTIKIKAKTLIESMILNVNDNAINIKKMNVDDILIINGHDNTILLNNVVNLNACDLWEFPKLITGINNIEFNNSNIEVYITYTPRFV